jgi:hypothetical protein
VKLLRYEKMQYVAQLLKYSMLSLFLTSPLFTTKYFARRLRVELRTLQKFIQFFFFSSFLTQTHFKKEASFESTRVRTNRNGNGNSLPLLLTFHSCVLLPKKLFTLALVKDIS